MPIYTYRCSNCGVQFEKQQSFHDQSLVKCPECGKRALKKVYMPVGIVFKGSGFYATDHHSPSGQTNLSSDKISHETREGTAKESSGNEKSANNGENISTPKGEGNSEHKS